MIYGFILCLGDSITNGARDEFNRGFPFELSDLLAERFRTQTWIGINRGVNGWTSADLLRNVYDIARSYPEAHEVTVCIGMNDSKPSVRTNARIFERNMTGILRTLKILGRKVYLLSVPVPLQFGSPDYSIISVDYIHQYNEILARLATRFEAKMVWLDLAREHFADSVHISNAGAVEIAHRVMRAIIERRGFHDAEKPTVDGDTWDAAGNRKARPACGDAL